MSKIEKTCFHEELAQILTEVSLKGIHDPKCVLEIGANRGRLSKHILEKCQPEVFVPSDKFLAKGNTHLKVLMDGEVLPFKSTHFDWIVSGGTFQWFDDLELSLKNLVNHLKPTGTLSFSYFLKGSMEPLGNGMKLLGYEDRLLSLNDETFLKSCLEKLGLNVLEYQQIEGCDYFESMSAMLKHLRFVGATHSEGNKNLTSSEFKALQTYLKRAEEPQGLPLKWKAAIVVLKL